jgi:hypothetical protein
MYSAKGCCTPACPTLECPSVPPKPPTGVIPPDVELSPELVRETVVDDGPVPFPKIVKLILVILAMLVVSALLLSL